MSRIKQKLSYVKSSAAYFWVGFFLAVIFNSSVVYGDVNLLINPGFEDGTTGWTDRYCSIEAVSSPTHSGSGSARVYDRNDTWRGIKQDLLGKMAVGQTYTISGWVRLENASSDTVKATIQQTDNSGTNYHNIDTRTAANSTWTLLSGNFTLTVDGTLTELYVYFEGPAAGVNFFVDDATVMGPEVNPESAVGQVDVNTRYQIIEGLGASGAWYTGTLVNHPNRNTLYDLLFKQLSLDIYRVRNAYQIEQSTIDDSLTIIQQAEAVLGRPLKIMISSWSPPADLKSNDNTREGTLKKDGSGDYMYPEFAQWWYDSLTDTQNGWAAGGVTADYINIQNECDYTNPGWDTCEFAPTETAALAGYDAAFEAVWQKLNTEMGAAMPKMLAPETTGFSNAGTYINNLDNLSHVYGYAHHLYNCYDGGEPGCGESPDSYIGSMSAFKSQYGDKPRFQTEYEYLTSTWTDAMNTALLLHNSLTVEEVTCYIYWDLFWGSESKSGLIWITPSSYTVNPVYYGFKHYSAFIDADWQRVDAVTDNTALRISAYISPDNQQLSVVLINTSTTGIETDLSFPGFSIDAGQIYRSSASENCLLVGTYNAPGVLTVSPRSIITLSLTADPPLYGDMNDDDNVNMQDLPDFLLLWLEDECSITEQMDLNGDCRINLYEFSAFAENWLMQ
jgi:glucuronoarabinoxylan endo-1,4-beta-xylanase